MLYIGAVTLLLFRKDARLPVQLQRAMAAEAEAAREARAKVQFDQKISCNGMYLCILNDSV